MGQPPASNGLQQRLAEAPSRRLFALLASLGLAIASSRPKIELVAQLHAHLTQPSVITAIVAQLTAEGKDALRQLLAANGALPVHTFETRYGPLRPYRPWHKAEAASGSPLAVPPWLAPISTTETLWYLGLIYRDPPKRQPGVVPHYGLPADLTPLLAAALGLAPRNTRDATHAQGVLLAHPGRNGGLDHHLAIWLATVHAGLTGQGVQPVHGRWLPPSVVALLCTRLGLDQDPAFTPIRSERHHPYLAFLHYLALAADLVAVTPAACQVTPTGWAWLTAPPATRQTQLTAAWHRAPLELAHPFAFRWEPLPPRARAFVSEHLATLFPEQAMPLAALVQQWRLLDSTGLLPGPRPDDWRDDATVYDPPLALIKGPLHWLGFVMLRVGSGTVGSGTVRASVLTPRGDSEAVDVSRPAQVPAGRVEPPAAPCTMPKQPVNTLLAGVQVQPVHLVRLATFCTWTIATTPTATPHTFTLAPDRIAQLAAAGVDPGQLLAIMTAALGRAPSRRVQQRLRAWAEPGQQLRLRPLLVLEADTPERLAQLRRHKLVRNRLGAVIAPNRISLDPADAAVLAQTLRTLGYYVEPPAAPSPSTSSGYEAAGADGGLAPPLHYFLITLYQGLGQHLALPIDLPWALRQALRHQLTALQQASAESAAHALLDQLQAALNGYLQLSAWHMPPVPDPRPVLDAALAAGADLELRYWGPSDGQITTRRVTPYWLEERYSTSYLIGWCHLRQQERTFRLDRIEAVRQVARPA